MSVDQCVMLGHVKSIKKRAEISLNKATDKIFINIPLLHNKYLPVNLIFSALWFLSKGHAVQSLVNEVICTIPRCIGLYLLKKSKNINV